MKIAFASMDDQGLCGTLGNDLVSCPYFTFVDLDGDKVWDIEIVNNHYSGGNVSDMLPIFIKSHAARVIIAGGMDQRTIERFKQFGVEAVSSRTQGTLKDVLLSYLRGEIMDFSK